MPRLLHIEDDPANRLLVRKLLTPAGFEVVDAGDGLEGVKLATEQPFDLILVDIAIPGLDGYEVTLRLRGEDRLKGVPIVAITAEGSRNTSLSVGCDGFLQKPIDARTFVRTVEGYLKGAREGISAETSGNYLRAQSARIALHLRAIQRRVFFSRKPGLAAWIANLLMRSWQPRVIRCGPAAIPGRLA